MKDKQKIIEDVNGVISLLSDTLELDAKVIELQNKMKVKSGLVNKLIKENASPTQV